MKALRRVALLAVLMLVGGLALSGCETSPSLAARVGDMTLTHEQVDDMIKTIDADSGGALRADAWGDLRQYVVQSTVFSEISRRYAAERGLATPDFDYQTVSEQLGGMPADNPLVKLSTEAEAWRASLLSGARQATPTEDDLKSAYQRFVDVVGAEAAAPYDQVKSQLAALVEFRQGLWLRGELAAAAERFDVQISPRYGPLNAPLTVVVGGTQQATLVDLPLAGPPTDAVRDLATTQAAL